jgi:hypothetical protein
MEVSGQLHASAVLPPPPQGKKPWYPLDRRLGGPQGRSERGKEKNSQSLLGLEPPIIEAVAQRYTDWAIPARTWQEEKQEK